MSTASQPVTESNRIVHQNGTGTRDIPLISPDAQIFEPRVDYQALLGIARDLLQAIGEDPDREGLRDTPRRWADWWREFIEYQPGTMQTTFENTTVGQIVTVSGIRVWSLCEHHLLPFWSEIAIGYIPKERTLGLSKFARIAHYCAHRLQVQERLVQQIMELIQIETEADNIGVIASGQHLCMTMRGIKTPGLMTTYTGLGQFQADPIRQFFLQLVKRTLGE